MTTVYLIVNKYQPKYSDGECIEVVDVTLDKHTADDLLDELASEDDKGYWNTSHTVFSTGDPNMDQDDYYIDKREAK